MSENARAVAETIQEACELVEAGFEYVTDMDGLKIFRKRKKQDLAGGGLMIALNLEVKFRDKNKLHIHGRSYVRRGLN